MAFYWNLLHKQWFRLAIAKKNSKWANCARLLRKNAKMPHCTCFMCLRVRMMFSFKCTHATLDRAQSPEQLIPKFIQGCAQRDEPKGTNANLRFPASSCESLRFSAKICVSQMLFTRKRRESAKICENLRLGSVCPP